MSARTVAVGALVSVTLAAAPAWTFACGACDEDTIAATYDHQVVRRAAQAGDLVVYCRVEGRLDQQRLLAAARRVPGIRKDSIRVSAAPAALSFALDPAVQSAPEAVAIVAHALPPQSRLSVLKVVGAVERDRRAP